VASDRKVVLVTRHTRLEELTARFQTGAQAKFYVEHLGADFADYEREQAVYTAARHLAEESLHRYCRVQMLDRTYLPSYLFSPDDVVLALGQDGLVANTMKYLTGQPLIGVNPDPARFDGVLLPFKAGDVGTLIRDVLAGRRAFKTVTMAQASLTDGQTLYAVNDLFVGPKTHTSARYEIAVGGVHEVQSSSGLIVSTGLGSTAWMKSIVTGSLAVAQSMEGGYSKGFVKRKAPAGSSYKPLPWDTPYLQFAVREPFPSVVTQTTLVYGRVERDAPLELRSLMPEHGVIFSDGIESDFLQFTSGMRASIRVAQRMTAGGVSLSSDDPFMHLA
jgi:NAD kinase